MTEQTLVWVIDDDPSIRWVLQRALEKAGMAVTAYSAADAALDDIGSVKPDVVVTDIRLPGTDGLDLVRRLRAEQPGLPIIVVTAHSDLESAVAAYEGGAFEYLPKPFDIDELIEQVKRATASSVESGSAARPKKTPIIGEAAAMQEVFRSIGRLARTQLSVLITGESGTGKELIARALHRHSPRADTPFIAINTAAIPAELLESELFGHERGAFTGASTRRQGRFEQAHGGTLFLDEIGDMPAGLQTRLLRVLEEGEFYRVGGHAPVKVDARIMAATHQNLGMRVREGNFREDLYHRLNVMHIHVPAVRERREDIPLLLRHFLQEAASELQTTAKSVDERAMVLLRNYRWPGNVREVRNLCLRMTVMAAGRSISAQDLPEEIRQEGGSGNRNEWQAKLEQWALTAFNGGRENLLTDALPAFEEALIRAAMAHTGGKKQDAARLLGWGRNTLSRKLKNR